MKETTKKIGLVPRISVFCVICLLTISGIICIISPNPNNNSDPGVLNIDDIGEAAVDSSNEMLTDVGLENFRYSSIES